jgi:choline-sulfatase
MYGEHREYAREMAEVFTRVRQRPRDTWLDWYGWSLPVAVAPAYREAAKGIDCGGDARLAEAAAKAGRLDLPLAQVFDVRVADRTIERLRSVGRGPFMVTCSLNYPHDPYVTPSPYYEATDPAKIVFPANFHRREPRFENEWARRVIKGAGEAGARELLRIYYGSVRFVDDQVGRVLDALEKTGLSRDTIVVFTADHGDLAGGHGMMWKGTEAFYDELVRIPLIIRYPGRVKPCRSGLAASHVDFMPTLLELAGRPVPSGVQGHSLAPYLLGRKDPDKAPPYRFCERVGANRRKSRQVAPGTPGAFAVRGRGWKYFRLRDGSEFLYDLKRDRLETDNLANVASFARRKKELVQELESWLSETGLPREQS